MAPVKHSRSRRRAHQRASSKITCRLGLRARVWSGVRLVHEHPRFHCCRSDRLCCACSRCGGARKGGRIFAGDHERVAPLPGGRAGERGWHRYRTDAVRLCAGGSGRVHFDDGGTLRSEKEMAVAGCDHRDAALAHSRKGLRGLRDEGGDARPDRDGCEAGRTVERRATRQADGDRAEMPGAPDARERDRYRRAAGRERRGRDRAGSADDVTPTGCRPAKPPAAARLRQESSPEPGRVELHRPPCPRRWARPHLR